MNTMIEDLLKRSRTDAPLDARHRSVIDLVLIVRQLIDQTITPDDHRQVMLNAIGSLPI